MNKYTKYIALAAFGCLACYAAYSQTIYDNYYPNPNDPVRVIVQQNDGRLIVGGYFDKMGVPDCFHIGRLYVDGTLDPSFNASAADGVRAIAIQPDGKIVVGGDFENLNGTARKYIGRFDANGNLDAAFNPAGAENYVRALAVQPDGKILVGGYFTELAGQPSQYIGRLNADGSLDSSFTAAADNIVYAIVVQPNGQIIIGGEFTEVNGTTRHSIARLNSDGSLDVSFNPDGNEGIYVILIQGDGKIIIAGSFEKIGITPIKYLARLNPDGSLDASFDIGTGPDSIVYSGIMQADGKILLGGLFEQFNGVAHHHAVRLNPGGSVDSTFNIGAGFDGIVYALYEQADGKIVAGGNFDSCSGQTYHHLLRLYSSEGKLDSSGYLTTAPNGDIYAAAVQRNDRILIGGIFTTADGLDHKRIARVGPCYDYVDATFTASAVGGEVRAIVVQPDDKIIIGGAFETINGNPPACLARLNADSTPDPSFTPGAIVGGRVKGLALQPDGKVVVGGEFKTIGGASYKGIARLNTDGTVDATFNPGDGIGDGAVWINSVAVQSDGKILVGGEFTSLGGQAINRIGRLNADGSVDLSFNPNAGSEVICIAIQPDGKILAGGFFHSMGGDEHLHIVRLDTNGTVDASFNFANGTGGILRGITLQCDGKIVISGDFTTAGGESRKRIARLNSDGSLDTSFAVAEDADNIIFAAMIQKDGKIICGGMFDAWGVGPILLHHQARVATVNAAMQSLSVSGMGDSVTWLRSGASPELTRCLFESSPDGATWTALGDGTRISGGWQLAGLALPSNTNLYIRATGLYCGSYMGAGGSVIDSTRLVYLTTPGVVITNVFGVITGYYGGVNYTLSGTNNANVSGTMWWTNSLGGSSTFASTNPWLVTVTGLSVGANTVTVYGANYAGDVASNSVTIIERRNDYMAADFDGDQWADPAYCNGTNEYEWLSGSNYSRTSHAYGVANTFPVAPDFDGDGYADPTVYDNKTGNWYTWLSASLYWQVGPLAYGVVGAAPVPADFDGDRFADFAVYAAGSWYVWFSTAGYAGFGPFIFGAADAIPVAGDFDGDRRADPAVYLAGYWYAWLSSINYYGVMATVVEDPEALPLAADFDGDGLCDLATVNGGAWYARFSTAGYQKFGPFTFNTEGWSWVSDSQ